MARAGEPQAEARGALPRTSSTSMIMPTPGTNVRRSAPNRPTTRRRPATTLWLTRRRRRSRAGTCARAVGGDSVDVLQQLREHVADHADEVHDAYGSSGAVVGGDHPQGADASGAGAPKRAKWTLSEAREGRERSGPALRAAMSAALSAGICAGGLCSGR